MTWAGSTRLRRTLVSLAVLAVLYGIASEIGSRVLPRRIWMGAHYIEDVELLPPYASLAEEAVFLVRSGILPASVLASGGRVLGGVILGALAGIPLGLGMAWAARVEYVAEPWIAFFRFTPAFALLPLYVLWFGFGEGAKILLIASGVAIVTLQGAFDGARRVPRVYLDAAASLGAGGGLVLRRLVVPAAVPSVLASLRIAVALAWVTMVVAELIKPTMPSLGYLLALAGAYPRVPTMLIGIVTIGALVLASDVAAMGVYRRGTRWMRRQDGG
ncbi:MAG TPA: ABC transporter permease subunit [Methylomirabilota bacterium]|nr:ABC transporter permease subunit [Methylomirabilota bacterium]